MTAADERRDPLRSSGVIAIGRDDRGWWLSPVDGDAVADAGEVAVERFATALEFAGAVGERERASAPRWVFEGGAVVETLLRHGVRLARCHDLGLVGRMLATRGDDVESALTGGAAALLGSSAVAPSAPPPRADAAALFDLDEFTIEAMGDAERDRAEGSSALADPGADQTTGGQASARSRAAAPAGTARSSPSEVVARARRQFDRIAAASGPETGPAPTAAPTGTAPQTSPSPPAQTAAAPSFATLAALESAGRLIAGELGAVGIPFDAARHDAVLRELIGERDYSGRPVKLEAAANVVRDLLREPRLNLDSPRDVLAALRRAGLNVQSTSAWELRDHAHPVVEPLVHYKHLARLFTANGWAWRDAWVRAGRLRTEYVPGGVVTGRWATSGGGALQLPREIRPAVVADPGWRLVVADAAQLEPRILAAMSGDARMAAAGQARDMYQAFVDAGVVPTRADAKLGLLGAMYGGTRGRSGELLPALRRAYPRALRFVESAARAGERGEQVATHLGRYSPWPPDPTDPTDGDAAERSSSAGTWGRGGGTPGAGAARSWGRFTRNFVVQGTAAEWALAWLARIRQRLAGLGADGRRVAQAPLLESPHLVYFLHDEVVVHAPAEFAEAAAREVVAAAEWAGCALFPGAPVAFPVTAAVVDAYDEAK